MIRLVLTAHSLDRSGRARLRAKAIRPSRKNELLYLDKLRPIVRQLKAAGTAIGSAMKAGWNPPAGKAKDAAPNLTDVMGKARAKFKGVGGVATSIAIEIVEKNREAVDTRLAAEIGNSVGIDIRAALADQPEILDAMAEARAANIDLIKSIPEQYFDTIEESVKNAWENGERWETLAARIAEVGDMTDERAALIARDQTARLNSNFNRVRQTGVGIEKYTWSTSQDERVRPSHRDLEGQVFRWDEPPTDSDGDTGHPGELGVNCRCVALPLLDEEAIAEHADEGEADQEEEAA